VVCLLSLFVGLAGCGPFLFGDQASPLPLPVSSPHQSEQGEVVEGFELIGTTAPDWEITEWIGSPPLSLAALRGKVVFVRWFAGTGCPYCSATAPALNRLHQDFARRGLVV
jgi:thiol-disulfide isomerase/thioredoxin